MSPPQGRLGPAGTAVLDLLACCPGLETRTIHALVGASHVGSTRQVLARLRRAGLVADAGAADGSLGDRRAERVWFLTDAGRAQEEALADDMHPDPARGRLPFAACRLAAVAPEADGPAPLLTARRALATVVQACWPRPRVCAWEEPFVRGFRDQHGRLARVRLPAALVLENHEGALASVLLLPDSGTARLSSFRQMLRRLIRLWEQQQNAEASGPTLYVVLMGRARTSERASAWRELLGTIPELPTRIIRSGHVQDGPTQLRPTPAALDQTQLELVLDMMARHPLLSRKQLADLLGAAPARVAALEKTLLERGLLAPFALRDVRAAGASDDRGLLELTPSGMRMARQSLAYLESRGERQLGLLGVRSHARARLLAQFRHTTGVNGFFAALARTARAHSRPNEPHALIDWRSAAACVHGRCRPDGYGCYQRGDDLFGFFLEFDRGTERAEQYRAKLEAYYRYRDTGRAARDYSGFPTVLFVSTSEAAESLFAHQADLTGARHGRALPLLLTTTRLLESDARGALGTVWRAPAPLGAPSARGLWLPPRSAVRQPRDPRARQALPCRLTRSARASFSNTTGGRNDRANTRRSWLPTTCIGSGLDCDTSFGRFRWSWS